MDDVWTDWQTDGWIGAHGHRWSHFFVTTPQLVWRRVGYELMNTSPVGKGRRWQGLHLRSSDFFLCVDVVNFAPSDTKNGAKFTGVQGKVEYELMASLTIPLDLTVPTVHFFDAPDLGRGLIVQGP